MARGGWANLPRVIWEDRSEVQFSLVEGVMSSISMGILSGANVTNEAQQEEPIYVQTREEPQELKVREYEGRTYHVLYLMHQPVYYPTKKTFVFQFERGVIQKKVHCKVLPIYDDPLGRICLAVFENKELTENADIEKEYVVDYYYEYGDKALIYTIQKERFNGLFTLEGKFYSKDENEGMNYTNLIYMPKVRVVSNIDLRLGEKASPTVSTFNIIGLPENTVGNKKSLILEITRLNSDEDGDI